MRPEVDLSVFLDFYLFIHSFIGTDSARVDAH